MTSTNDNLFDDAITHAIALERFKTSEAIRIAEYLRDEVWPSVLAQVPDIHKRGTLAHITAIVARMDIGIPESMQELAKAEAQWALGSLEERVPLNAVSFSAPGLETLNTVAAKTPALGKSIEQWLQGFTAATADTITRQLKIGIAAGEDITTMQTRLKQLAIPKVTRGATALSRTIANAVSTAAREETYKANDDVVKAVQLVATLDSRTTVICMGYDGQVYPVGQGPRPPFHWQCRTTTVPITYSWAELGARHKREVPRSTRASMDGQVPAKITYDEWLKKQPRAVQVEALGPARANMLRAGNLKVGDLTDSFGAPLNIDQLMFKAPIAAAVGGLTETRDQVVTLLFEPQSTSVKRKLKTRGWEAKGINKEFAKPSKDGNVRVVMWRPPGTRYGLPIRQTLWNDSLVEYSTQYVNKIKDIDTLLSRRVRYHGNSLLVRAIEGRLKTLGWSHAFPTDANSLGRALRLANSITDVELISGTLEHALRRAKRAKSASSKAYWERQAYNIRKQSALGVSAAELDAMRQLLLKKFSPAKVRALIVEAKTFDELKKLI